MTLRTDLRHGLRIGRAEFMRSVRGYFSDTRRAAGMALFFVMSAVIFWGALQAAYAAGQNAVAITNESAVQAGQTALPLTILLLTALRTIERIGSVEAEEFVLTAVHPRAAVIGLLTAELGRLSLWLGIPIALFVGMFASGLGTPWLVLTTALVLAPIICWGTVWGYALGITALRLLRRLPGVRRVLKIIGVLSIVGMAVGVQYVIQVLAENQTLRDTLLSWLTVDPVSEYVSLALVGTPLAQPVSFTALIALAAFVLLTPVGLTVATRQASALWFTDQSTGETAREPKTSSGGFTPPRPFAWTPSGRMAWALLVRTKRRPQELSHLLFVLIMLGSMGAGLVQSTGGLSGGITAALGTGLGVYLAGATFGLNPLGDEQVQLPFLLVTERRPHTIVRGRVLAGLAVGATVVVTLSTPSVALGLDPVAAALFAVAGCVLCLPSAGLALGLGSAYPIDEQRNFWGVETVVPSQLVLSTHIFIVTPGTALGVFTAFEAASQWGDVSTLFAAWIGGYLLLTGGISYLAYRYAIRRHRRYEVN